MPFSRAPQAPLLVLLTAPLLWIGGCRAAEPPALQWPVPAPPRVEAADPVLWVALAARLGSQPGRAPLPLRSGKGALTLRDAGGRQWRSSQLTVHWLERPLDPPLELRRLVAGPFASFESAQRVAQRWQAHKVATTVARPGDWEVWARADAPVPAGLTVKPVSLRYRSGLQPALQGPGGTLQALQGPVSIEAPGGLLWQGARYAGPFRLQADAYGTWSLVEQVPLERYLEGVVPHEIGAAAPPSALAAQAVLARTWALRNQHRYSADGYHLCASTQCQVYSDPRHAGPAVRQAITRTRHQVLSWQGEPIHAVYHASNGGLAAGLEEGWSADPLPYLKPRFDGPWDGLQQGRQAPDPLPLGRLASLLARRDAATFYGADHPLFRWSRLLNGAQIAAALQARGMPVGEVRRLQVLERGASGRVVALAIEGTAGRTVLRLDAIRRTLPTLPSTLFELSPQGPGLWRALGGGFGHGAGLSQAGAIDLGRRGWSLAQILERYYPGTQLQTLQQLKAWGPVGSGLASSP